MFESVFDDHKILEGGGKDNIQVYLPLLDRDEGLRERRIWFPLAT